MADLTTLTSTNPSQLSLHPGLHRSGYNASRAAASMINLSKPPLYSFPSQSKARKQRPAPLAVRVEESPENSGSEDDSSVESGSSSPHQPRRRTSSSTQAARSRSRTPTTFSHPDTAVACVVISDMPAKAPTRHRPTRSRSAPPERMHFSLPRRHDSDGTESISSTTTTHTASLEGGEFGIDISWRRRQQRNGYSQFNRDVHDVPSPWALGAHTRGGELLKPAPPLHRPTTFWRRTTRSGVTASSYSPSSHVIRRATFIAAGLTFDHPVHDLSAMGVESRVRSEGRSLVQEVLWEVIPERS